MSASDPKRTSSLINIEAGLRAISHPPHDRKVLDFRR
jgi:hypothetical protein